MPGSTASASSDGRILVVGPNWIGDSVMAMPALQAFRGRHPGAHLALLVKRGLAPLWSLHDAPQQVLAYEEGLGGTFRAARAVRAARFDRCYVLPHSFRSAVIPFLAGVPQRLGMPGHGRDFLLTRVVPPRRGPGRAHQQFEYADLLLDGAPVAALDRPSLRVPPEAAAAALARVEGLPRPWLGLLPGAARGPAKRWPEGHFADVARRWVREQGGGVLLLGGREDAPACGRMAAALGPAARDLAGRTSLVDWAATLAACEIVLANDSGGMHLAAALGRPVVAVFGLTDPASTGPLGPRCRVVHDGGPSGRDIPRVSEAAEKRLAALSPQQVYEAVQALRMEGDRMA